MANTPLANEDASPDKEVLLTLLAEIGSALRARSEPEHLYTAAAAAELLDSDGQIHFPDGASFGTNSESRDELSEHASRRVAEARITIGQEGSQAGMGQLETSSL